MRKSGGLIAFERLGGLLICLIAIHMITFGAVTVVKENFNVALKKQEQKIF